MMNYQILILALVVIFPLTMAAQCQRRCGHVDVPYPFGLVGDKPGCFFNQSYAVDCHRNSTHTVPYLRSRDENITIFSIFPHSRSRDKNVSIISISLLEHELRIRTPIARRCYSASGNNTFYDSPGMLIPKFPISKAKNKYTAMGCDTIGEVDTLGNSSSKNFTAGNVCLSTCSDLSSVVNGTCSGVGCCQTDIPIHSYGFEIFLRSFNNHTLVISFNNCSYAFVAANDSFNFSSGYLTNFNNETVPTVLEWSVGDGTCEEAKMNRTSYMCKENSTCSDVDNGSGYRCKCSEGYQGNPYLSGDGGCQDIDECTMSPCVEHANCQNNPGNFTCFCLKGYQGDGRKAGTRCQSLAGGKQSSTKDIALGVSISISVILLLCSWLYWGLRQRKIVMQRDKFFQQNGGLMLQKLIAEHKGSTEATTIFTIGELKMATNNFHESTILGQGGHGTVYKGELNNKIVAIKKAKFVDQTQIEEFINEVVVLTQVNHKNVVKLIGCCLETEVPLLVYEFVTNGSLCDHIHKISQDAHMSWRARLRIATETAGALSYLHSDATTQIIHRDIKTANILLDDDFTAKVSDFGASRLNPIDQTQGTTLIQGTLGYLDPEYLNEMKLTHKSDVYSFGVVLIELLTGMKALSFARPEKQRNLSTYFVFEYKDGNLLEIIDKRIFDAKYVDEITKVAKLATQCLEMKGKDRPSMKEVSMELEGLFRTTERHSRVDKNCDETEYLVTEEDDKYGETSTCSLLSSDSIKNEVAFQIGSGR